MLGEENTLAYTSLGYTRVCALPPVCPLLGVPARTCPVHATLMTARWCTCTALCDISALLIVSQRSCGDVFRKVVPKRRFLAVVACLLLFLGLFPWVFTPFDRKTRTEQESSPKIKHRLYALLRILNRILRIGKCYPTVLRS